MFAARTPHERKRGSRMRRRAHARLEQCLWLTFYLRLFVFGTAFVASAFFSMESCMRLVLRRPIMPRVIRCRHVAARRFFSAMLLLRRAPRLLRGERTAAAPSSCEALCCGNGRRVARHLVGSGRSSSSCVAPSLVQRHVYTPARRSFMS